MKLFIGLTLLSTVLATQPVIRQEAPEPAYEAIEQAQPEISPVIADFVMFQIPDISPAFIDPDVARLLNEFGEIREEIVYAQFDGKDISPVKFVDAPIEAEYDSAAVDAVLVADAPLEQDASFDNVPDPVLVADAPLEQDANFDNVPDPVLVADAPLEQDVISANVADSVLVANAPLEKDASSANGVDAVLVADAPLEEDVSFGDAAAPSALEQLIAKLLANRRDYFPRDNPMLR